MRPPGWADPAPAGATAILATAALYKPRCLPGRSEAESRDPWNAEAEDGLSIVSAGFVRVRAIACRPS